MEPIRFILASSSPRRKELFSQLNVPFEVIASGIDETLNLPSDPKEVVRVLSLRKAQHVAQQQENAVVIGADSMVYCDGEMIGKPSSEQDAVQTLQKLRGREHTVLTGVSVVDNRNKTSPQVRSKTFVSKVTFKPVTDTEIEEYVATGEPMDKAGSYSRSGTGKMLIQSIEGSKENVSGLPTKQLKDMLKELGILL